jgi:2-iminobutanoate/2-iminopropanoate deaminase
MRKLIGTIAALVLLCPGVAPGVEKKVIRPEGAEPSSSWSYGILVDGTLYISGMGGEDAQGKVPPAFEAEMRQSLQNIGAVLKAASMSVADVVSVQVYLTDVALFDRMNAVYKTYFSDPKPTRTTVVVSRLVGAGHIEITVTAKRQAVR